VLPLRWFRVHVLLTCILVCSNGAIAAESVQFNRDVRPILSENCFACHGADKNNLKGKRRLDSFEGATAERNDIRAIAPGDPANSDLWLRVLSEDDEERMPPRDSHKTLTSVQKETLKRWIAEGANYQTHWAYVAPSRPAPPAVKMGAWPRSDLDRFVLANLEKQMLTPAPEANRTTLIRRLALDLTGLPPTPTQVGAFLADTSSDAYERVVDRLLQSPHYGERMAVDWLDAARYADTNGYQVDRDREIWAWRDWVIQAFNENKRFDQFTVEQLAGDLLPQPTLNQRIATGFNRADLLAIRPDGEGDVTDTHVAWRTTKGAPLTPSVVVAGDELYGVADSGIATCWDAKTGTVHWQERIEGNYSASPIVAEGKIFFLSEDGVGTVVKAAQTFEKIATNKLEERALASYAVADGALFIRTAGHLYRIGRR